MNFKQTVLTALSGLSTHKGRSALTILGIVIGVASIIAVMSLGSGAQQLIVGEISQLGAETVAVIPGDDITDPTAIFADLLTQRDVDALSVRSNVPDRLEISPIVITSGLVSYRGESYRPGFIIGADAEFFAETFGMYASDGASFTKSDIQAGNRVVMIGRKVKNELFGDSDAIGESIMIRDSRFRVVGVSPAIGQRAMFDIDELVLVPYTSAQTYLVGGSGFHRIIIKADSPDHVNRMAVDIENTLRDVRNLRPDDSANFSVVTQQGLIDQISTIVGILTAFLVSVVAISLVVGGIGIMNIMLVSVTERTKEIGLRKALGATRQDILRQFLMEAVILTVAGGLIGIALGALVAFGASLVLVQVLVTGWEYSFPISSAVIGVGVSATVGLVFGIYPANQASKKSPIEALRYE